MTEPNFIPFKTSTDPERLNKYNSLEECQFEKIKDLLNIGNPDKFCQTVSKYNNRYSNPEDLSLESFNADQQQVLGALESLCKTTELNGQQICNTNSLKAFAQFLNNHPDKAEATWQDFLTDHLGTLKYEATHTYETTNDNNLKHTISNINNSGLDICVVNNKFTILNNAELNNKQYNALVCYFRASGKFPENYDQLNGYTVTGEDNKSEKLGDKLQAQFYDDEHNNDDVIAPEPKFLVPYSAEDDGRQGLTYRFITPAKPVENTAANRAVAEKVMLGDLNKIYPGIDKDESTVVKRITHDWGGGLTISIWPDEASRDKDDKIDSKSHVKGNSTKLYACHISGSQPPVVRLFIPNPKNFTADNAASIINYLKAMGYSDFELPGGKEIGKETFKAFLEASVSEKMPIRLKHIGSQYGGILKKNDLKGIDKFISGQDSKLNNWTAKERITYLLKWSNELQQYADFQRQNGSEDAKDINIFATQYLQRARFEMVTASMENISDFINSEDVVKDNVDTIAAKYAFGRVMTNVSDGKLPLVDENGKLVMEDGKIKFTDLDPFRNNCEQINLAIKAYMLAEKPTIEKKIKDQIDANAKDGSKSGLGESTYNKAFRPVENEYKSIYENTLTQITSLGGVERKSLDVAWPSRAQNDRTISDYIHYLDTSHRNNQRNPAKPHFTDNRQNGR